MIYFEKVHLLTIDGHSFLVKALKQLNFPFLKVDNSHLVFTDISRFPSNL